MTHRSGDAADLASTKQPGNRLTSVGAEGLKSFGGVRFILAPAGQNLLE